MMFDPTNICTTGGPSTGDVTMESILEAHRKLKELAPRPKFDCIVCLPQHFEQLKKEARPLDREPTPMDHLCGIPVHVEPTETEVMVKAVKLSLAGRRVAAVFSDGTVKEINLGEDRPFSALWELTCKLPWTM